LCADAVIVELSISSFPFRSLKINIFFLHKGVCPELIHEIEIVLTLPEIQHDAAACFGYFSERGLHCLGCFAKR
jgi:hypothetical protein